jgi:hypothetical protein
MEEESDELELQDRLRAVEYEIWRKNAPFLYGETNGRCLGLHMSPAGSAPAHDPSHLIIDCHAVPVAVRVSSLDAVGFERPGC